MWIVIVSVCSAATLVLVLVLCSCWKRQRHKDDWLGLDGMVKQKNPDENVNHIPLQPQPQQQQQSPLASVPLNAAPGGQPPPQESSTDASARDDYAEKRPSVAATNTRRSLPDIPAEGHALQVRVVGDGWDVNGDNSSELYATVGPYNTAGKRTTLPNGMDSRPSISQHSSISQADDAFSPYASVNYDKLPRVEHPYAIVKPPLTTSTSNSEDTPEPNVRTSLLGAGEPSTSEANVPESSTPNANDINAASAVAGGIAANQELPYITMPINGAGAQVNFSGDSQDSSKGYTSISVREPLVNLRTQTVETRKPKRPLDPHYSTVSDDSDEMYTTIPDPMQPVYTSGSETYAQIHPHAVTVAADIYPVPSSEPSVAVPQVADDAAPQPPSVDSLKHISHSRQEGDLAASSTSSIMNLGSPKPEKRQANSPLPPPPALTLSPENARRNLDDMYAKVQKNRKQSAEDEARKSTSSASSTEARDERRPLTAEDAPHDYETLKKSPKKASGYELPVEPGYASINGPDSLGYEDPNYEQLKSAGYSVINKGRKSAPATHSSPCSTEHNYESVPGAASDHDPNYESVPNANDPNYESVKYADVGYERLAEDVGDGVRSERNGYETVDTGSTSTSSALSKSPPYEKLHDEVEPEAKTDSESSGYERIDKSSESTTEEKLKGNEDDYETIKNDLSECLGDEDAIFEV